MLTVLSIVILVLEALFLGFAITMFVLRKRIFDKQTILLTIPIFWILFFTYVLGIHFSNNGFTPISILKSLASSLSGFKFDAKDSLVTTATQNAVYNAAYVIAVAMAGVTLVFSVLGLFWVSIFNFFKVTKTLHGTVDVVIGYNEQSIEYCKNNRRNSKCVIFINSAYEKITKDDKNKLFSLKIPYIFKNFKPSYFERKLIKSKKINFIYLDSSDKIHYIYSFLEKCNGYDNRSIVFYVLANADCCNFVSEQITIRCQGKENLSGYVFDKHELLARYFSMHENIALHLPRDFFDGVTLKKDKKIWVNIIGCGKTGKAMLKSLIINNQFVVLNNNKFECYPIEYNLYDKKKENAHNSISSFINKFNVFLNPKNIDAPEVPCIINPFELDIDSEYIDIKYAENDNEFAFTIISLDKTIKNCTIANNLQHRINNSRNVIFYGVDYNNEVFEDTNPNLIPFGFKSRILTHDIIVNDSLGLLAELNNKCYWDLKKPNLPEKFHNLPLIQKQSNIYADINIQFKLNLLGLDMVKVNNLGSKHALTKEEFEKYYKKHDYKSYEEYFEVNTNNALAVQEHLRWNAFYLFNGYTTLDPKDFVLKNNEVITKNEAFKKHGCLTSYYGLDKVHKAIQKLYKENGIEKEIFNNIETYRYDSSLMNNVYDSLALANYKIIFK